ncbi:MAG: hypothetical protein MUF54_14515 [Polyangiaceae bacterium]|nr:hypothetical protein [Polyangiaceae bacterium]
MVLWELTTGRRLFRMMTLSRYRAHRDHHARRRGGANPLNLPAVPESIGPGGSLAWDLGDERMDDWVVGMDPEPPDVGETQRGPPCDACVDPPAPDC